MEAGPAVRRTSAPQSQSARPHVGPATIVVSSTTRMPASGPLIARRAGAETD
jgi:hypothetical protein